LLLDQNPKNDVFPQPTKAPTIHLDKVDLNDLNFKVSAKKQNDQTKEKNNLLSTEASTDFSVRTSSESWHKIENEIFGNISEVLENESFEESEESWVAGSGESAFFLLDMHPDLGDPIEQLGIEIEDDPSDNITDFIKRFGEKLLWDKGVNVTELEEEGLLKN
jgi:hypothetical protein